MINVIVLGALDECRKALVVPGIGVGNPLLCTCLLKQGLLILCMQYGSFPPWLKHIQICISNLSLQSEQYSL